MKIWILIWRLNPPHLWHMRILNDSLKNNNKTILLLSSANIVDEKNPYSFQDRKKYIRSLYKNNLVIDYLDDFPSDEDWIINIKTKLEKIIDNKDEIIFYGWDFKNDYAIKVLKRYYDLLWFENIIFKEISRKDFTIVYDNKLIEVSSTKVRETIKNWDKALLEKLVDKRITEEFL